MCKNTVVAIHRKRMCSEHSDIFCDCCVTTPGPCFLTDSRLQVISKHSSDGCLIYVAFSSKELCSLVGFGILYISIYTYILARFPFFFANDGEGEHICPLGTKYLVWKYSASMNLMEGLGLI